MLRAIWARKDRLVELLIENGADVNKELRIGQRWSPLYVAAESGLLDIARLLIDNGADVNKTLNTGWTALDIASLNGDLVANTIQKINRHQVKIKSIIFLYVA